MKQQKNIPALRFPGFTEEWEKKKLGEVGNFIGGGTPSTKKVEFWNGNIPWISSSDLTEDSIYQIRTTRFITEEAILSSATKLVPQKSILIVSRVGVGKVAINENVLCTSQDFTSLSPYTDDYIFLAYLVKLKTNSLLEFNQGTSIKGFVKSDLETLDIKIPTLPEQQKIAAFLTAVDDKLQALKKKKALLEQYKKGVMQQLFTGQLRFKDTKGKDFPDWEEKKLGEVFYSEKGKGISKNKVVENGKYECVLYGELYTKYNEVIFEIMSKTNVNDGIQSKVGDLLIPSSTTTTGIDLANVTALNKDNVLLGGDITVLRSNIQVNNIFYAYYLSNHKRDEIASYAQGSTIIHLYYSHVRDMTIDYPSLPEQTAIAQFLSALDHKIAHTQQQIAHTEQWKKGLLQQLFV